MKTLSLLFTAALAAAMLFACSNKKQDPVTDPAANTPPPAAQAAPATTDDDAAKQDSIEAARLEAQRARAEALMNQLMSDDIYFDFDRSELTEKAKEVLAEVGDILNKEPRFVVTVEGHTDERGTEDYNMTLGANRATKVKDYLVAYGIAADRLQTVSYGEENPKAAGHTEADYKENRRANFKVHIK
ncbi:MAG: OmpA family protein [Fibrobacter sp.]|jgi:peptidoglycan-associated lipoprotein|nr:OmpA family protein [Fibrobacter sp.]